MGAEGLFHDQPPPGAVRFLQQSGAAEFAADRGEGAWWGGQIEQAISTGRSIRFQLLQSLSHRIERSWLLRVRFNAGDALQQALGGCILYRSRRELAQTLHQAAAQIVGGHAFARDAADAKPVGQQPGGLQIVERGYDQAVGQVAGHAENHERAGIRLLLVCSLDLIRKYFCHDRLAFGLTISGALCRAGSGCCCGSLWPPKPSRIAERIFSANVCSLRERKRANNAAVSTSAGTASSMAALIVQRPSPESSTKPE